MRIDQIRNNIDRQKKPTMLYWPYWALSQPINISKTLFAKKTVYPHTGTGALMQSNKIYHYKQGLLQKVDNQSILEIQMPQKNQCSSMFDIFGLQSQRILMQLFIKSLAAYESSLFDPLTFLPFFSSVHYQKQLGQTCFKLSIIFSCAGLGQCWKLYGWQGEQVNPVEVNTCMAMHPNPQTSFFRDLEYPFESKNSGSQQCSSLLLLSSSLEGTKEVERTALMKSSPFLLQSIFLRVILLCPLLWQCICCSPNAICFKYLLASAYSNGPNSQSRFLREQFLYQSEITYLFSCRVTSAYMESMLGCSKVTLSFFQRGIKLTKQFSPFQKATCQLSWVDVFSQLVCFFIISYSGWILLSYSKWMLAEGGRVLPFSEGGVRLQFLLTFLMELGTTEVIILFCTLMLLSLLSMKSCFLLASNSSFFFSFSVLVLFSRLVLLREDRMFSKRQRNLLFSSNRPSLQSKPPINYSPPLHLLPRADLIFSNLYLNLLWLSLLYLPASFLFSCAGVRGRTLPLGMCLLDVLLICLSL